MRRFFTCLLLAPTLGCGGSAHPPADSTAAPPVTGTVDSRDSHAHEAPHGGTLVEFGEEFAHLEFVLDTLVGTLTAYALDGEAENAIMLTQREIALTLTTAAGLEPLRLSLTPHASVLTGETAERSSTYAVTHPHLKETREFSGVISRVEIKGVVAESVSFRFPENH